MKRLKKNILLACTALLLSGSVTAQGIHFSQYYNAPMLLNPANTALMSETDYRLGANYRNQWAALPVPFKTFSGYADFQVLKNHNLTNWLGLGLAMFSDEAGDGRLSMNKYQGFVSYHVQTGNYTMISAGLSGAYVQRSVDFNKLSYNMQWDGFKFDRSLPNGEESNVAQTDYIDVGAGVNLAYYPNEYTYIKLGLGVDHLNVPTESFYNQYSQIKMRPTANLDAIFITSTSFTINPSVYYTMQGKAQELVYGIQASAFISEDNAGNPTNVIFGAYHRWNDALIPLLGFQWAGLKLVTTYDFTFFSDLSTDLRSNGALEFSLIYQGSYTGERDKMNCPRF